MNRICEGKEYGFVVDYVGLLGELDKALTMYSALEGFDEEDLAGALSAAAAEVEKLPQRYSDLWDLFKEVKNRYDEEAYEVLLADEALRQEFYQRLAEYARTMGIALSTEAFVMAAEDETLRRYKEDLRRFQNLRAAVRLRYAETVDYRDYETKIKKLLDTHIQAYEVTRLNEPVNIFDEGMFNQVKEERGIYGGKSTGAQADIIAHATKRVITEKMDEDPAFYEAFSKLIQRAIEDFRAKRINDLEYLNRVTEIRHKVVRRQHDDLPARLEGKEDAAAYFGIIKPLFGELVPDAGACDDVAADVALAVREILNRHGKIQFWDDYDAQNRAMNDIDDYLFDEIREKRGINLTEERMDEIIGRAMQVARSRSAGDDH